MDVSPGDGLASIGFVTTWVLATNMSWNCALLNSQVLSLAELLQFSCVAPQKFSKSAIPRPVYFQSPLLPVRVSPID